MPDIQQILARLHDPNAAAAYWQPVLSNIVSGVNDPAASGDPTYGQRVTTPGQVGYNEAASWLVGNPGNTVNDYFTNGPGADAIASNNRYTNNRYAPAGYGQSQGYTQPPISQGPQQPYVPPTGTPAGLSSILRSTGGVTPWGTTRRTP